MKPIILVEGTIGVGKTTIAKQIAQLLNFRPLLEPVDSNPYLERFYKDMKRWAFPMQMELLLKRYSMHKLANFEAISGSQFNGVVLDRGLPGDRVFAKLAYLNGNFSELEWGTYDQSYEIFSNEIRPPNMLLFLDIDPRIAKDRLEGRDRKAEEGIPIEYYEKLHKGYLDILTDIENNWKGIEILKIGWNSDFLPIDNIIHEIKKRFNIEVKAEQKMLKKFFNE